jgi:hypothetical protein
MCVSLATHNISLVNAGFIEITVISPNCTRQRWIIRNYGVTIPDISVAKSILFKVT